MRIAIPFAVASTLAACATYQDRLDIDVSEVTGNIPSLIYGAGAEDVNHEIYGGLYDQRIFGESMEEPAASNIEGFSQYDSPWACENDVLLTEASHCAKIIHEDKTLDAGSAEVKVRVIGDRAISGFIAKVSDPANGDDRFNGYEICLNAASKLVIGKHENNWQSIAEIPLEGLNPKEWNTLRVDFDETSFTVFVNGKEAYTYRDDKPLKQGNIGLRSFNGPASFRDLRINGEEITFVDRTISVSGMWNPVGNAKFILEDTGAAHGRRAQRIEGVKGDGICNMGLNKWGIGVEEGQEMTGYVYLRGTANAYVALQNADGSAEYARQSITGVTQAWRKYEFKLTPNATDSKARFVVALDGKGSICVDMVMLRTENYPYRKDITEAFTQENLTFLRYGGTMVNAPEYMTGNMIGPADKRPPYTGHWYQYGTNGFGIIEFVKFARLIGTEPTFSVNIEDNPEDVLRLLKEIEPYGLKYIEIGNEECIGDASREAYEHYVERFLTLYEAIHPVYPELRFINAAWWRADKLDIMEYVFRCLDGKSSLWDYHPWTDEMGQALQAEQDILTIKDLFKTWNPNSDMRLAILEENGNTHCQHRALSHALMLNAVRRLDGFVQLDSPANALQPYLQNDNGWDQGQIFFNSSKVWCQPPYYVQQVAAAHHQPLSVKTTTDNANLNVTATRNERGDTLVVHVVNMAESAQSVKLELANSGKVKSAKIISVSGGLEETNTPDNPENIIPKESEIRGKVVTFAPYSYNMIQIATDVK